MTVPYTFGTATTSIPLSNLDANFNTPITLGNTSIYLGNTTTTIGNLTLTNATISSGNVTLTNVTVTTANVTNITVTGTANIATGNVTTLTSTSITDSGLTSGRVTFAGASGLLTDSATFVFNGTQLGVGTASPGAAIESFVTSTSTPSLRLRYNSSSNYADHLMDGNGSYVIKSPTANGVTSGTLYLQSGSEMWFSTGGNFGASQQMRLDSSGNLGIAVTPAPWLSTWKALQVSNRTSLAEIAGITFLGNNFYQNSSSQNIYLQTGFATLYSQNSGQHNWQIAPSGTAGNVMTLTTAMTLNDSGNLSLSITPSAFGSTYKAFQAGGYAAYVGDGNNGRAEILNNAYASANNVFNYFDTNSAGRYSMQLGVHAWFSAGSGSANAQITWTQAMTLDASGNLLLGGTSNAANARFISESTANANQLGFRYTAVASYYWGCNSSGDAILNKDGTERIRIASGGLVSITGAGTEVLALNKLGGVSAYLQPVSNTDASLQVKDSGGTVTLTVGTSSTTVALQGGTVSSGTGIAFPATQNASANANTLDDYEEGTFTPTISGSTSAGTGTYTTQSGSYTKIGRQVSFRLQVFWSAHTGTGGLLVTSLPFTCSGIGGATIGLLNDLTLTALNYAMADIVDNTTSVRFRQYPVGGTGITDVAMSNASNIVLSGTYFV
jgi:hypothetical protein